MRIFGILCVLSIVLSAASAQASGVELRAPNDLRSQLLLGPGADADHVVVTVADQHITLSVSCGDHATHVTAELGDSNAHEKAIILSTICDAQLVVLNGAHAQSLWSGTLRTETSVPGAATDWIGIVETTHGEKRVAVGKRENAGLCSSQGRIPGRVRVLSMEPRAHLEDFHGGFFPPGTVDAQHQIEVTAARNPSHIATSPALGPLMIVDSSVAHDGGGETQGAHASPASGQNSSVALATMNRELSRVDGDTQALSEHGSPSGAYLSAHLRWKTSAFAIAAGGAHDQAMQDFSRPKTFWLVSNTGARVQVNVPEDPGLHAGERYWIDLPSPVEWQCVSMIFGPDIYPAVRAGIRAPMGLTLFEASSPMDGQASLDDFMSKLADGAISADEAQAVIPHLSGDLVRQIIDRLPRFSPRGRAVVAPLLVDRAEHGDVHAKEALVALVNIPQPSPDEASLRRQLLVNLATTRNEDLAQVLTMLATTPGPAEFPAAIALARRVADGRSGTVQPLPTGFNLEEARPLLAQFFAAFPPLDVQQADKLLAGQRGRDEQLLLCEAASHGHVRNWDGRCALPIVPMATDFETRFRLARLLLNAPMNADFDNWLETQTHAEEWMLRQMAYMVLARHGRTLLAEALADSNPRVRETVVRWSIRDRVSRDVVVNALTNEHWPRVRRAALSSLAEYGSSSDAAERSAIAHIYRRFFTDAAPDVRVTAINIATQTRDRDAWAGVHARLADQHESAEVRAAAVEYMIAVCSHAAIPDLMEALRDTLNPNAPEENVGILGVPALQALAQLGGETRNEALRMAARPTSPPALIHAAERYGDTDSNPLCQEH